MAGALCSLHLGKPYFNYDNSDIRSVMIVHSWVNQDHIHSTLQRPTLEEAPSVGSKSSDLPTSTITYTR